MPITNQDWHALWCLQTKTLNEGIARFYDESSGLWESMWGEHMHHGEDRKSHTLSCYCYVVLGSARLHAIGFIVMALLNA